MVKYLLRIGTIFYGGNFAVRADALDAIGGFDTSIEFHGEDTNVGRRLFAIGRVEICHDCHLYTSARRYNAMGKGAVFRLYVRNFTSELLHHRPRDTSHVTSEPDMPDYEPFLLCDFHIHTQWSDGKLTVAEVVDLGKRRIATTSSR